MKGGFTTKDTKSTKFDLSPEGFWPQGGVIIFRTLRVLRDLRGEIGFLIARDNLIDSMIAQQERSELFHA